MRRHLKLVPRKASKQASEALVQCLRDMLEDAEAGNLIGVVGVQMFRDMQWETVNCGETTRSAPWCYAMLGAYSLELAQEINRA